MILNSDSPTAMPTHAPPRPRSWLLIVLLALLIGVFLLSLALGSVAIPLDEIIRVLFGGQASRDAWTSIILKFRLPKALTALLAGAALGIGGLQMQTLFRNPLADPFVLGISSGASLGVALVVLTHWHDRHDPAGRRDLLRRSQPCACRQSRQRGGLGDRPAGRPPRDQQRHPADPRPDVRLRRRRAGQPAALLQHRAADSGLHQLDVRLVRRA